MGIFGKVWNMVSRQNRCRLCQARLYGADLPGYAAGRGFFCSVECEEEFAYHNVW
jgi:hypothetical protein